MIKMEEEIHDMEFDEGDMEFGESNSVWDMLTPEQKRQFIKLSEKSEDNLRYIG